MTSRSERLPAMPPGILISAPGSGTGKTTVMLGLLRALKEDGLCVQPFKSGPDYIDPAFHRAAAGRASYNLDSWAMTEPLLCQNLSQAQGADLILTEGSMGLFDGVSKPGACGNGASANIAIRFGWPVILVLDVSGQAQSAAAIAMGFANYHPDLHLAGVILNRVASPRHERLVREGFSQIDMPILGALPRRGDLVLPERHLGLVQAREHPELEKAIADYADFLRAHIDLEAVRAAARKTIYTPEIPDPAHDLDPPGQRIALAQDDAFSFVYPHILTHWKRAGATILPFSPLADQAPDPDADIVWLPGGYPELHAGTLAAAECFKKALDLHARTRPIHGECGGYMVLGQTLIDKDGQAHAMAGLLGLVTSYHKRKFHLGYRHATLEHESAGLAAGTALRGHEFHYCSVIEQPDQPFATVLDAQGEVVPETGSVKGQVSGTFFHMIARA